VLAKLNVAIVPPETQVKNCNLLLEKQFIILHGNSVPAIPETLNDR